MQVTVSVVAMYVTVSSSDFIFLSLTDTHKMFIKLTRNHQKALHQICISLLKSWLKDLFSTFVFPIGQ